MKRVLIGLILAGNIASAHAMVTMPSTSVVLPTINELIPQSFYVRVLGLSSCVSGIYIITSQLSRQKNTLEKQDVARYLGGSAMFTAGALALLYAK
jgi:hypothetical protein